MCCGPWVRGCRLIGEIANNVYQRLARLLHRIAAVRGEFKGYKVSFIGFKMMHFRRNY